MKSAQVKKTAKKILNALGSDEIPESVLSLSILFTTDRAIHLLNRDFRGKDKPTDVLSFPLLEGDGGALSPSLGDLVISLDTAARQSREYGVTLNQEVLRLMIHGILHLCGYDHEKVPAKVASHMRRTEQRIFEIFPASTPLVSRTQAKKIRA